MERSDKVAIKQNILELNSLAIDDQPTVAYIASFDASMRETAVVNCIQLGARASQFARDRIGADSICEKIDASVRSARQLLTGVSTSAQQQLDRAVESVFGRNGKDGRFQQNMGTQLAEMQRELTAKLDPDQANSITAKMRKAVLADVSTVLVGVRAEMNLADPKSPLGLLRTEFEAGMRSLEKRLDDIAKNEAIRGAVGVEHFKGSEKGNDFEDALHPVLQALSGPRHDNLDRTSHDAGLCGRSKRGDFVIEVNPREAKGTGLRIVIEAKNDRTRYRELLREIDEAMANRGAQFGIGVSTNPELLPEGAPPICFPAVDKIVVMLSGFDSGNSAVDWVYLEVALEVARYLAIAERERPSQQMDLRRLDELVKQALNAVSRFTELKKRLSTIANTANDTNNLVDVIRAEVRAALDMIRDAIDADVGERGKPQATGDHPQAA